MNPAAPPPSFQREVLPILRTACIGCHTAPNPAGGISLGSYAELMKGGKSGAAVVPGKSKSSRLVLMLTGEVKPIMPPGPGLKAGDIETVRRWVDAGAKDDAPAAASATSKASVKALGKVVAKSAAPVRALGKLRNVPAPIHALAFSPDGKTLAIGTYGRVLLCDPTTRQVTATWGGHADAVRSLAFSPDGKLLAAGGGMSGASGEARVWSVPDRREARVLGNHTDSVNAVAFSPDGKLLATGSADKTIQIWDAATGKPLQTLRDHADAVLSLAFRNDGKFLASSGADKSVKVWDTTSWKRLYTLGGDEPVTAVAFAPSGNPLVTAGTDRTLKVWNFGPESSSLARNVPGHGNSVWSVSLSPDGKFAATASGDKTVKLWKMDDGGNVATLSDPKDWVYAVRFRPDGKQLAGGTWDGTVYFWDVETRKLEGTLSTLRAKP